MANYEDLTDLCQRLPAIANSLTTYAADNKENLGNLRDIHGQAFMNITPTKTSNELKRRKTLNGISKQQKKVFQVTKINAKLP